MGWIDVSPREELMSLGRLEGAKAVSRVTHDTAQLVSDLRHASTVA